MENHEIIFADFVKIGKPNQKKTAELILKAKGNKRTMAAFAKQCGTSASTLSRIVNGKNSRKCSDELLEAIFKNADPDANFSFDELMEAQGMAPKLRNGRTRRFEQQKYEQTIEFILFDEIISRGFSISRPREEQISDALNYPYRPDLCVVTDAIDGASLLTWHFEFWSLAYTNKPSEADYWNQIKRIRQKLLMNLGMIYMDKLVNDKMSFVVTEKYVYDTLIRSIHDTKLKVRVSVILVDLEDKCIKEEYQIPVTGIDQGIDFLSYEHVQKIELPDEEQDIYNLDV